MSNNLRASDRRNFSTSLNVKGWGGAKFLRTAKGQHTVRVLPVDAKAAVLEFIRNNPHVLVPLGLTLLDEEIKAPEFEGLILEVAADAVVRQLREVQPIVSGHPVSIAQGFTFKIDVTDQLNVTGGGPVPISAPLQGVPRLTREELERQMAQARAVLAAKSTPAPANGDGKKDESAEPTGRKPRK
jgi:hypothetical protein